MDTNKVKFSLVTTGLASQGSIASKLYPDPEYRDVDSAVALLNEVAENSNSQSNKAAYTAYLKLSDTERENLAHCVYILDSSPNITDTKEKILKQLRYTTRPQFQEAVYQRLEGIWFDKVINHLSTDSTTTISQTEISECISDLQEQFRLDNLPIDFLNCIVPTEEALTENQKVFVEQLRLVTDSKSRIQKAISDYYKAFGQRSRWIRDELLFITELESYEKRLIDEWERQFEIMIEDIEDSSDFELKKAGRSLFNWMDQEATIHIRPLCTEPYVMRGSYHMLSNEFRVGWHSQFVERLRHMIEQAREAAAR